MGKDSLKPRYRALRRCTPTESLKRRYVRFSRLGGYTLEVKDWNHWRALDIDGNVVVEGTPQHVINEVNNGQ